MKKYFAFLLGIGMSFYCLTFSIYALSYTDQFTDLDNNTIKSYSNLSPMDKHFSFWQDMPDHTVFGFQIPDKFSAHAMYRVQNAEQISVGFYTASGTCVYGTLSDPAEGMVENLWLVGIYDVDDTVNTAALQNTKLHQAALSPSTGEIYATIHDVPYKAVTNKTYIELKQTTKSPNDLTGYGINVYVSIDGKTWSRILLQYTARVKGPLVYEEMAGKIPSNAQLIKVELNDYAVMDLTTGGVRPNLSSNNGLAAVRISGENLTLGIPEPVIPEPVFPTDTTELEEESHQQSKETSASSKASSSKASSSKASSSKASSSKASSSKASSSSVSSSKTTSTKSTTANTSSEKTTLSKEKAVESKPDPPKFEGVIHSSVSSGSAATAAKSASSKKTDAGEDKPAASSPPIVPQSVPAHTQNDAIFLTNTKNDQNKPFTVFITLYIIVVTGALAYMMLSSSRHRK